MSQPIAASIFAINLRARAATFIAFVSRFALLTLVATAHAQTITVLHAFTNGNGGAQPYGGVTLDHGGNLYGTTYGYPEAGTVYKLSHKGSGWILDTLYVFNHPNDPTEVMSGVVFGPDGTLYGTGSTGGANGMGAIYNLRPPANFCPTISCPWTLTNIYSFTGGSDGARPAYGNLVFDSAGNIYGTARLGGGAGCGTVFKLTRSGNSWTETVLYSFNGTNDGCGPQSGVTFDSAGNLYGTTFYGGINYGNVYELSPSGSGWNETSIYNFTGGNDGGLPIGGVAFDGQGNLYGTTAVDGSGGNGTIWELSPANGSWVFTLLHSFGGGLADTGPYAGLTLDAAGNFYGTSSLADNGNGEVFKLTPTDGGWTFTAFDFNASNGAQPIGGVSIDAQGNLYGTAATGGNMTECFGGCGVVWEITP